MSLFHETLRDLFEDIHKFLNITLNKEHLTAATIAHKESLLMKIHRIRTENPQLHLKLLEEPNATKMPEPSSPQPYTDMGGRTSDLSVLGTEYIYSDATGTDTDYEIFGSDVACHSSQDENDLPLVSRENSELEDSEAVAMSGKDGTELTILKCGYLEKKGKDRLSGLFNMFQKRWVVIRGTSMFFYNKSNDKNHCSQLSLEGYEVRPMIMPAGKDIKRETCFELVCPAKKTYQFVAVNAIEMSQWVDAIQAVNVAQESSFRPMSEYMFENNFNRISNGSDLSANISIREHVTRSSSSLSTKEEISDDFYEVVGETEGTTVRAVPAIITEDEHDSVVVPPLATRAIGNANGKNAATESPTVKLADINVDLVKNHKNWYVGLWDCCADDMRELSFCRGDLVCILNKDYDYLSWWLGEINGKIGFVPKNYLMEAFELDKEQRSC